MNYIHGTCEYCGGYSPLLRLIKVASCGDLKWTKRYKEVFTNSFLCCQYCVDLFERNSVHYERYFPVVRKDNIPYDRSINRNLLDTGIIGHSLIKKMKTLEEIFPEEINGIYIISPEEVPAEFRGKTNVLVSFKDLSLVKYFRHVFNEDICLFNTWKDSAASKFQDRASFWTLKRTRILLALSRIHTQSEILAIWVWSDTKMVSIEFFCKIPVNMVQAEPKKITRVM
jgi:hypothetical protein